jgi:hypothetical protein
MTSMTSLSRNNEPAIGTWVKDKHGAAHIRIEGGWAPAPHGFYPGGQWQAMWDARGPLVECGPYGFDDPELASMVVDCRPAGPSERDFALAVELAEEAIGYVGDYFREKWGLDERLATLRALVPPEIAREFWR